MSELQSFLLTLLSSAGTSVILSGALVWLVRSWISERLRGSIQHEYDQRLAALNAELKIQGDARAAMLKAEIDKEAGKLRFVSSSYSDLQRAAINRRLDAIESLWAGVLATREATPPILAFFDILTVDEYVSAKDNPTFRQLRGDLDQEKIARVVRDVKGSLERTRPYVGEYIWAVFSTYQSIILRIVLLVHFSQEDSERLNWHQDHMVRQLMNSAFTADELAQFEAVRFGRIDWIRRKFEHQILAAIDKVLSGKAFSDAAMEQARRMEEQVTLAKREIERRK